MPHDPRDPKWSDFEPLLERLHRLELKISSLEEFCALGSISEKCEQRVWGVWWDTERKLWRANLPQDTDSVCWGNTPQAAMSSVVLKWRIKNK